jgi:molecular chaperone DnaK (HSP70)
MSTGSAAALNYGVFRRKDLLKDAEQRPQTLLIYDVGATNVSEIEMGKIIV